MDKDNKCSCTGFLAIAPILADSYLWSPVSRRSGGAAYPGYPRLICPSSMRSRAAKVSRDT